MEATKLILTNRSALQKKYKSKTSQVIALLEKIKTADKKKNINTSIHFLDDKDLLKRLGGTAVTKPGNQKQNKDAVDLLYQASRPDYILLFGNSDIIPFIDVLNPVFQRIDDNEDGKVNASDEEDGKFIQSDLPYASNVAFTKDFEKYFENGAESPARAVGRIPDVLSKPDLVYIKNVVNSIIRWKPQKSFNAKAMVLAAHDWSILSKSLARKIFKTKFDLILSPSDEVLNIKKVLKKYRIHLINCHGGEGLTEFLGERDGDQPTALITSDIDGSIKSGTIVVAESCYGAHLFFDRNGGHPICQNYLEEGAYAFLGSTCSSYGSTTDTIPTDADIICRNFLLNILNGRSTGSALLESRLEFKKTGISSGIDRFVNFKTMLQFYLLGDPSIHLIKKGRSGSAVPKGVNNRRKSATKKSAAIRNPKQNVAKIKTPDKKIKEKIRQKMSEFNMVSVPVKSYKIEERRPLNGIKTGEINNASAKKSATKKSAVKFSKSPVKEFNQHVIVNKKISLQENNKQRRSYKILFINEKNGKITTKCIETK